MSKFKANIVIVTLTIILGFIVFNIISELRENKVSQHKEEVITQAKEETKDMTEIIKQLESEIHKTNKLLVLEGNCKADITYSDKDIHENTNENFKWIKNKFSEWKSRELKVSATYKFGFSYDLQYIKVSSEGENIIVDLSKNNLNIEYLELVNTDSLYTESIGWLSKGDLSPQEINVLQERMKIATFNSIQSNAKYRKEAFSSVVENIEGIGNKLGIKVICRYNEEDVVENNQVVISN